MVLHLHTIESSSKTAPAVFAFSCEGKEITLDLSKKIVMTEAGSLALFPGEVKMIHCLVEHAGCVCTKRMLFDHAYEGKEHKPTLKIVDVRFCLLRKRLSRAGLPDFITTVHGRGYRIGNPKHDSGSIKTWLRGRWIPSFQGPCGEDFGAIDLETLCEFTRWTRRRKMILASLYRAGLAQVSDISRFFGDLSEREFKEWEEDHARLYARDAPLQPIAA